MLLLTRRPYEKILIGDDIVITVTDIKPGQVRIGIDAPKNVSVIRDNAKRTQPKDYAL